MRIRFPSITAGVGRGKCTQVFCPRAPSIRTKGPVARTEVSRLGYSTCMLAPCIHKVRFGMILLLAVECLGIWVRPII